MTDDAGNKNNLIEAPSPQDADPSGQDEAAEDDAQHDANSHDQQLQAVSRVEALRQSDNVDRSGTSTPEYARTAAEVADSAAWVDPATPEPEISDAAKVLHQQLFSDPPHEDTAEESNIDEVS